MLLKTVVVAPHHQLVPEHISTLRVKFVVFGNLAISCLTCRDVTLQSYSSNTIYNHDGMLPHTRPTHYAAHVRKTWICVRSDRLTDREAVRIR